MRTAARRLKAEGVEAIAVCFLHGYLNGAHERRAAELILDEFPEVVLSISSDIAPEIREYFRACTTAINAAVQPVARRYLTSIQERLRARWIDGRAAGHAVERRRLHRRSGGRETGVPGGVWPGRGVIAATHLGGLLGYRGRNFIRHGRHDGQDGPDRARRAKRDQRVRGRLEGVRYGGDRARLGLSDHNAGHRPGRDRCWRRLDRLGGFRRRAAGRAAVGRCGAWPSVLWRGGTEPTVTDAQPGARATRSGLLPGWDMQLDVEAATRAIHERCALPLDISTVVAANGIIEIANAAMVNALRLISVQRGYDPRDFVLVAFGGGGPVHANRLAAELSMPLHLDPAVAGRLQRDGLLVTDLKHDFAVTRMRRTDAVDLADLERIFDELLTRGRDLLTREDILPSDMEFARQVDIRYVGQSSRDVSPCPSEEISGEVLQASIDRFHDGAPARVRTQHAGEPTELVNVRLTARARFASPNYARWRLSPRISCLSRGPVGRSTSRKPAASSIAPSICATGWQRRVLERSRRSWRRWMPPRSSHRLPRDGRRHGNLLISPTKPRD